MATLTPSAPAAGGTNGDSNANGAPGSPSRPRGRGRGRGQGQGRGRGFYSGGENNENRGGNNNNGGRRGGRGGNANINPNPNPSNLETPSPQKPAKFGGLLNGNAESKAGGTVGEGADEAEAEVCFICASPVVHESLAPCNHRTCHICSLRMRALYKDKNCAHCRTEAEHVIFTNNSTKRFEDFTDVDIKSRDINIGIWYDDDTIREDTLLLLRYNCPDEDCLEASRGWPALHHHVRTVHKKKICDLCSRHKKVFTHEHELLTDAELSRHMRKGDDNPGAADQSGFKGHPLCTFCGQRFYGDDELYVHCREAHERCQQCDQVQGRPPQYFVDYASLRTHLIKDHFFCEEGECREKRYIAFNTELDLKAHIVEEHSGSMSKDVRRDARVVDINSFDYRTPYVQERRGGGSQREQREGRGRGRGRDPNAEPIPPSSAQPLRRDEQAFQRQMAIHSAQSVTTRTFGGQLSAPTPAAGRGQAMSVPRPSPGVEATAQAMGNLNVSPSSQTPQDQARALRHQDVIDRATVLLQNDQMKLNQFRNAISSFKSNAITAGALIDNFFGLFADTTSSALGTLIREIADLYEDPKKADSLRTAWNNWRAINEDYPSLPAGSGGASNSIPLNWAVTSSSSSSSNPPTSAGATRTNRVLKLKSSTAQSSRSSVSQTRSWGSASQTSNSSTSTPAVASASLSNPFPGLPPAGSRGNQSSTKVSTVPWVASSSLSSNPSSSRPSPASSRPASGTGGRGGGDMFPALPKAAKPQSTIMGYGSGRLTRAGPAGPSGNAWAASGSAGASAEQSEVDGDGDGEAGGKKKKGNKGKKQVLMNWG